MFGFFFEVSFQNVIQITQQCDTFWFVFYKISNATSFPFISLNSYKLRKIVPKNDPIRTNQK